MGSKIQTPPDKKPPERFKTPAEYQDHLWIMEAESKNVNENVIQT